MQTTPPSWVVRMLLCLLREGDRHALLGDLSEEHERLRTSRGPREAARWCRNQAYASLAAVLRLRIVEFIRAAPWGIALAAYVLVGVFEVGFLLVLSRVWPEEAHPTSALRLLLEFPGVVGIAYLAARSHRSAAFVLGAMMLLVAVLLTTISTETMSAAYVIAFLTVGPVAALLGGMLHRGQGRIA